MRRYAGNGETPQPLWHSHKSLPYHDHNAAKVRPRILDAAAGGQGAGPGQRCRHARSLRSGLQARPGGDRGRTAGAMSYRAPRRRSARLTLSGLPPDRFMFCGLPAGEARRAAALPGELKSVPATLIFFDTRDASTGSLEDIADGAGASATWRSTRELTKLYEEVIRGPALGGLAPRSGSARDDQGRNHAGHRAARHAPPPAPQAWSMPRLREAAATMPAGQGRGRDRPALRPEQEGAYARLLELKEQERRQ